MAVEKSKDCWRKFTTTGKIEDYLSYKFAKKKEEAYEKNIKEKRSNTEFEIL